MAAKRALFTAAKKAKQAKIVYMAVSNEEFQVR